MDVGAGTLPEGILSIPEFLPGQTTGPLKSVEAISSVQGEEVVDEGFSEFQSQLLHPVLFVSTWLKVLDRREGTGAPGGFPQRGAVVAEGKTIARTGETIFDPERGVDVKAPPGYVALEYTDGTVEFRPFGAAPGTPQPMSAFGPTGEELGITRTTEIKGPNGEIARAPQGTVGAAAENLWLIGKEYRSANGQVRVAGPGNVFLQDPVTKIVLERPEEEGTKAMPRIVLSRVPTASTSLMPLVNEVLRQVSAVATPENSLLFQLLLASGDFTSQKIIKTRFVANMFKSSERAGVFRATNPPMGARELSFLQRLVLGWPTDAHAKESPQREAAVKQSFWQRAVSFFKRLLTWKENHEIQQDHRSIDQQPPVIFGATGLTKFRQQPLPPPGPVPYYFGLSRDGLQQDQPGDAEAARVAEAIERATSWIGSAEMNMKYNGNCLVFVKDAYGLKAAGFENANAARRYFQEMSVLHTSGLENAPRGSWLFFRYEGHGNAGHVAISTGPNTLIDAFYRGNPVIQNRTVSPWYQSRFQGWVSPGDVLQYYKAPR